MNIGIMVLSLTGNTLQVAERLAEAFKRGGHEATIERVVAEGEVGPGMKPVLVGSPDPEPYDALVFASLVQAFHLAAPMKMYMEGLPDLGGKPFSVFTTQQLKWTWMGGKQATKSMCKLGTAKGGRFLSAGMVNWSRPERDEQIDNLVQEMVKVVTSQ